MRFQSQPVKKVLGGKFFDKGLRLQCKDEKLDIAWGRLSYAHLGRIKSGDGFLALELHVAKEPLPFLLDPTSTDLSGFLGEQGGPEAVARVVERIAESAPHAVTDLVKQSLPDKLDSVPSYLEIKAFSAGAKQAFANRQGPSPAVKIASQEEASLQMGPGIGAFFLTSGYLCGMFFLLLAGWSSLSKEQGFVDQLGYWLGAGFCLTLSGLGTIKARTGPTRPYLEQNLWLLRSWFVLAGMGFILMGLGMGAVSVGGFMALGGASTSALTGASQMGGNLKVSKAMLKFGIWVLIAMGGCVVLSLVMLILGLNMMFLALSPPTRLLNSATVLDYVGIKIR